MLARALEQQRGISVEGITAEPVSDMGGQPIGRGPVGAMADLVAIRGRAADALTRNGPGPVTRSSLLAAGLTAAECRHAAQLERWRLQDTGLVPGMPADLRTASFAIAAVNARVLQLASLWQTLAALLEGGKEMSGQISIAKPDVAGHHPIILRRIRGLHESLRAKPILHLDATMRPELLQQILPQLAVTRIDVAAPHMHVRMVSGSFGKSMLCPAEGLPPDEARRRTNRLRECVDYVRWHAQRVWPARVLVVTYLSIEAAFADIPNVATAHFNAVAGLDGFKDVALLISIGRPLPPSQEIEALCGAYFGEVPLGRYRHDVAGLRMASGLVRGMVVLRHQDPQAETMRAAICDDELIQVVGRGRAVNRTAANLLEVHILADAALPLVYDRLAMWDVECPDVVQQMLLA